MSSKRTAHNTGKTRRHYLNASPALWLTVSDVRKPTLSTGEGALPTGLQTGKMDWVFYTGDHYHSYKQHIKLCGGHLYGGQLCRVMAADSGGPWFEPWPREGLFLVIFPSLQKIHQIRPRLYLPKYISSHHLTIALQNSLLVYCKLKYKWGLEWYLEGCTKDDRNNMAISRDFGKYGGRGEYLRRKLAEWINRILKHTHTHTHIHIYIYPKILSQIFWFKRAKSRRYYIKIHSSIRRYLTINWTSEA